MEPRLLHLVKFIKLLIRQEQKKKRKKDIIIKLRNEGFEEGKWPTMFSQLVAC